MRELYITNSLSRKKEIFKPINEGHVGLYVCGPTVYGDAHLGHARPGVTYDVLVKLLKHLGYKVRYVRNITDVGHLEHDADEGEDKIAKKARLEQLEPMEVVQRCTLAYHEAMRMLNVAPPSIEPRASGHIIEQIDLVKKILEAGYAYESNGSIYFDVLKYDKEHKYGILSGRTLDEVKEGTRELDGQQDKRASYDFALWKKASPEHIMRWPSPWSDGFPGWHLECSAMSEKYLGKEFDIHGGGKDLRALASAAGVQAAPALAYGEFVSAAAPETIVATNAEVRKLVEEVYNNLCDDLNTPMALAQIFEAVRIINTVKDKKMTLDASDYKALVDLFDNVVYGVLGLRDEETAEDGKAVKTIDGLINMVLEQRKAAKAAKDWATSDRIRDDLKALGVLIKDTKDGTEWTLE